MRGKGLVVGLAVVALAGCSSGASKAAAQRHVHATMPEVQCVGATPELAACIHRVYLEVDKARRRLERRVVGMAVQPEGADLSALPSVKAQWRASASAFVAYRNRTCDAVYLARIPGTWSGIEADNCRVRLTRERIALLRLALEGKGGY